MRRKMHLKQWPEIAISKAGCFRSTRFSGAPRPRTARRRLLPAAVALIALAGAAGTPGTTFPSDSSAAQPEQRADLPLALAERIARAFFTCARRNDKPRTLHILDAMGATVLAARMDGQFADNIEVARLKAETALYFRDNTRVWLQRAQHDPVVAQRLAQLGQFVSPTGLPIVIDGQLVGAIGVGGASGDCAHEALSRVLGPQPPLIPAEN
ncbi:GlcG/HbpS family heme-binding protein [Elongatibacter sediminis]|uniref:Heme-binding protein n=1 Tax=Elongatibacter sediminis TaxID=3119006 RepID=A0AAW9RN25_9GAMM